MRGGQNPLRGLEAPSRTASSLPHPRHQRGTVLPSHLAACEGGSSDGHSVGHPGDEYACVIAPLLWAEHCPGCMK